MPDGTVPERVRAAARGDRKAAEALLRGLLPRARNLVRYLVRGDRDVDDITQNACLVVLKGLSGYRGDAPFEKWADRIVARETFRHLKRSRLQTARELPELAEPVAPSSPDDAQFLARRALAQALDTLPEAQRVAVVLHHVSGLTAAEIAELLVVSKETVRSRLRLGMGRLRDFFPKEEAS